MNNEDLEEKMSNIVIGIEGEVASGKTSTCRSLVKMIDNSTFIDGGAIYRGIIFGFKAVKSRLKKFVYRKKCKRSRYYEEVKS